MGRGGGCVPGKLTLGKKKKAAAADPPLMESQDREMGGGTGVENETTTEPKPVTETAEASSQNVEMETPEKLKIYIVYYSTYGHVASLAKKLKEGVDSVEGVEGYLYQVPETLSKEVLSQMQAPGKDESVPIISAEELPHADAIIFGFPTRYGAMAAQMKAFFDTTGKLWQEQSLAGKPGGFFVSTGAQGGGQETTAWTAITQLTHHGMIFIPIGYTFGAGMFKLDEIRGGSPYGAGTYAGDGTRLPSETELALAEHQGKYTAGIVKRFTGEKKTM